MKYKSKKSDGKTSISQEETSQTLRVKDESSINNNSNSNNYSINNVISGLNIVNSSTKKRKLSTDDYDLSPDEADDDTTKWNLQEKLNSTRYDAQFVKFLNAKEFDLKYFQENGFQTPLVFTDKSGLGLRVPSENFKVSDVKACVGSKRIVDVVDVDTQQGLQMTMKDWCAYYENQQRDKLLNVISLEFSHTKLENYVEAPQVVRHVDWIDNAWPQALIAAHTESTNAMDKMKYPKVQKYVLMSVAGCYTDFHIDMGGTSVWYHVLKGSKIFWLIPPTEENLKLYQKWTLSGQQSSIFFPDLVTDCQRIELKKGWTFMLPSGWIHGVYTKEDSLVFGGNFLHNYNIPMQIKVYNIENKTKVPSQHRYPFFLEIMWFAMERYIHCLTGVTHLIEFDDNDDGEIDMSKQFARQTFQATMTVQHLTKYEYDGLKALLGFLKSFPVNKRQVPKEIIEPDLLLEKLEKLINERVSNETNVSVTGQPVTYWPKAEKKFLKKMKPAKKVDLKAASLSSGEDVGDNNTTGDASSIEPQIPRKYIKQGTGKTGRKHNMRDIPRTKGSIKKRLRPQNIPRSQVERRRRVRCHQCEPCTRDDCGECKYCKDMKKFGGTGVSKQCCLSKQCLAPLLPTTSVCMYCDQRIDRKNINPDNAMYECEICFEIYHLECFKQQYKHLKSIEPIVNEDLVNCWTCSNCISKGFHSVLEKIKQESKFNTTKTTNNNSSSMNNTFNTDSNLSTKNNSDDECYDYTINDENHSLSLDSLSNYDKKIILEEFCEIINENNDSYVDDASSSQQSVNVKLEPQQHKQEQEEFTDAFKSEFNYELNNESINNNNDDYKELSQNANDLNQMALSSSSSSSSSMSEGPATISQILQVL